MKKWVFWLVIILLLGYEAIHQKPEVANGDQEKGNFEAQAVTSQRSEMTIQVAKDQIYQGNLVLINQDYPVHQVGMQTDIVNLFQHKELVKGFGLLDSTIRLSQHVVQSFSTMIGAADKEGVRHFVINSGYRDNKEQSQLYKDMGADYALPAGNSEHNLGLALDIGSSQSEMSQAPEGIWLTKNAWTYGFILRYPKDKTAVTGIQYEPWHFRYVGLPHSLIMQQKNLTLEQYLEFLKKQKTFSTTVRGVKYEISYYPISKNTTIQVPKDRHYEISGNNMDGVIVTVF
ncbi:VanY-A/VanY-F/VanY-M family D-Ala-D-Ala carboxypeptidase [Paenibacillus aceris]|uniref:D-alanyl-D-alanine carboxypeptidase n=1 Tax=Paenibacillus aceris TaxID=869555 RepID=A0ABS4I178_9BACL|nr:VanY-A/VanY-F/VanY-M family D-Ala-D-Ala carboxypeptidase [Paenibacillus aceris]MBP1964553.1 D-alanyl-D-alanine carboxypeptidase [Paenibacillus aceris]NHW35738.1 VanY-A/VanY-F/VanY-M family D-Ala-D-Ala carboxypeptidase [Paenibacillus aceris]